MVKSPARTLSLLLAVTVATGAMLVTAVPAQAATTITVASTSDEASSFVCDAATTQLPVLTLRRALCVAGWTSGQTIVSVPAGTYLLSSSLGAIAFGNTPSANVTVQGTGQPVVDASGNSQLLNIDPLQVGGITTALSGLTFQNGVDNTIGGGAIIGGTGTAGSYDSLTVTNSTFTNNAVNTVGTATNVPGGAIQFIGGKLTIDGSTFNGNSSGSSAGGAIAYQAVGPAGSAESLSITNSTFTNNSTTTKTSLVNGGGAVAIDDVSGTAPLSISSSTFRGNVAAASGGNPTQGGAIQLNTGTLALTASTFDANAVSTTAAGAVQVAGGTLNAHFNRFAGTSSGNVLYAAGGTVHADENWWGCAGGPGAIGCDTVAAGPSVTLVSAPYLTLKATATPQLILPGSTTSTITASLLTDSANNPVSPANLALFDARPVSFNGAQPTGTTLSSTNAPLSGGTASVTYFANSATGAGSVTVGFDNATLTANVGIGVAPAFTSATSTLSVAGSLMTPFTVKAPGYPQPALTIASGTLPSGVTLTDNGNGTATISGTPAVGSAKDYPITLKALSASGQATQTFTLIVNQKAAITSASSASFPVGTASTFTVTTSGRPVASAVSESGALPNGVTFVDNGDGTALLSGTPAVGSGGVYPLTLTATNSLAGNGTQAFTLTVPEPTDFTSAAATTFTTGQAGTFTVTTTPGYPTAKTLTEVGALPAGVTFVDNGDGTATISGTPNAGTGGTYPLTLTAVNGTAPNGVVAFVLTVNQAPAITLSAAPQTVNAGNTASFTAVANGYPLPSVAWSVSTDSGLTFNPVFGATSTTLSFTATQSQNGDIFKATFTNAAGTISTQAKLTVGTAPTVSSAAAATFRVGSGSQQFTVTTSAIPNAVITTSALPAWLTFTDHGDGTGTFTGTPPAGSGGQYPITITADNTFAPTATQAFVLTVTEAPTITSANATAFTVGTASTFTLTTTPAYPATTALTEVGTLPTNVTFVDLGNGTAHLAGTPAAGSGGTYAFTVTATNGTGTPATQAFTLTVDESPAFSSAAATTFIRGVVHSFTVKTAPSFPHTTHVTTLSTLPAGITFTDNGDGTATIAGTTLDPAAVSALTLTASNGSAPDATQTFTLTVADAPDVTLPLSLPSSSGPVGGVPSTVKPGDHLTLTASGFAGDSPVTFGIYSTPVVLAIVNADPTGHATATITIPAGYTGAHTLIAAGTAPNGSLRYLLTAITLPGGTSGGTGGTGTGTAGGSTSGGSGGSGGSGTIASTGLTDMTGIALLALLALAGGASILVIRRRRARP